jgi:hypothetical protein
MRPSISHIQVSGSFPLMQMIDPCVWHLLCGASHDLTQLSLFHLVIGTTPLFPLQSLTHLPMDSVRTDDYNGAPVYALISNAPLLEMLSISSILYRNRIFESSPSLKLVQRIPLPRLCVLKIEEVVVTAALLLQVLPSPSQLLSIWVDTAWHNPLYIPVNNNKAERTTPYSILQQVRSLPFKGVGHYPSLMRPIIC